eukprot:3482789-Amphidinium_carterae.1
MKDSQSIFNRIRPSKCRQHLEWDVFHMHRLHSEAAIPERLLTGCGLDFLAEKASGSRVDNATLQLIGLLFASILMPGFASLLMAQQQKHS